MEVLAGAGLQSVLFMDVPTPEQFAPYASWRGIGIAGTARRHDPRWMDDNLPPIFEFLSTLTAPITHYKVCSTFDSAPGIGSIGKAMELALPLLAGEWTPLVVPAPPIGRYQMFGNLFAVADGVVHRLDRHPTMSRHPITPMGEADIRRHLADQTEMRVGLVDALTLNSGRGGEALQRELQAGNPTVAFDMADEDMLAEVGRLIWENRGERLLAVGSQGVEYALIQYWRKRGLVDGGLPLVGYEPVERLAAVSASTSPVTATQLRWAGENGFELIRIAVDASVDLSAWSLEIDRTTEKALECIKRGRDPIVYTALGPDDRSIASFSAVVGRSNVSTGTARARIGEGLGQVLDRVVRDAGIERVAVAGGDTSSHVAEALQVRSLTLMSAMGHGSSIMKAEVGERDFSTLEISLKGGQMGSIEYFGAVRDGHKPT